MKTNFFIVNKFIALILLTTHAHIWNMFNNNNNNNRYPHIANTNQVQKKIIISIEKKDIDTLINQIDPVIINSFIATEHNRNNTFLKLPNEIFYFILEHSIDTTKPLKDIIKPILLLSTTCKKFNTEQFLITMGKACTCYSLEEKNKTMKMLLENMHDSNYYNKRHAALLLTYAGAENNSCKYYSLLKKAIQQSDEKMILALFENNTNPNQKISDNEPTCFCIKNVNIAKIFIKYSADLNAQGDNINQNILFASLCYNHSPELIKFYINNKVDVNKKNFKNNNLLHALACKIIYLPNIDYIKIGTLFIKAAPNLLNELNDDKQTPLNIAQQQLKNNSSKNIMVALIKLFEEHGGKTAEQLKQDAIKKVEPITQPTENPTCCICYSLFENPENITNIPCKQKHTDKICLTCYKSCLKFSDKCPLCRGTL